jgi:hypothetical protein
MHADIENDVNERLQQEVQALVDNLAPARVWFAVWNDPESPR